MSAIKIISSTTSVSATTPFHPDFAPRAKRLGGKWNADSKTWVFDVRDLARVRALCRDIFGDDGDARVETCTLRLKVERSSSYDLAFYLCGRLVARATGRDSGAKLGPGVITLSGGFSSGGSVKNPAICTAGCTFELRDVPRPVVEARLREGWGSALKVVSVECVPETAPAVTLDMLTPEDRSSLEDERAVLVARLAHLDALLGKSPS